MGVAAAVLAIVSDTLPAQAPDRPPATVIRAGTLIDPEAGTAARNQSILVENGKITAIGASVSAPAGATIVDLSRAAVMPGLFDVHTHLCMDVDAARDAGNYFHTILHDPDSLRAIQGVVNAKTMLEAGFTTVRDVGNEGNYACTSVRKAIERGLIPGPTMQNAGRILAPYGGQFRLQPDRKDITGSEYIFADTRDEMIKGIRENIHYGATVIKIVVDDQPYIYSPEDIRFMVDEAARAGLKLAAHVWTRQGAHNAALAGVASMEHLNGADEQDLETANKNGTTAVFTPFPLSEIERQRPKDVAPSGVRHRDGAAQERASYRHAHRLRERRDHRSARPDPRSDDAHLDRLVRPGRHADQASAEGDDVQRRPPARRGQGARNARRRHGGRPHRHAGEPARQRRDAEVGRLRDEEWPHHPLARRRGALTFRRRLLRRPLERVACAREEALVHQRGQYRAAERRIERQQTCRLRFGDLQAGHFTELRLRAPERFGKTLAGNGIAFGAWGL
jgi:imidazolonepropionase-like amidohydrolase